MTEIYENDAIMQAVVDVLLPTLQPGEMIIRRGAFRWRGPGGAFLSNHYECQSLAYLCEDHGYTLVHDLNHIGVVRLGRA